MGTSAARRAPTTRLWRLAKGAATRYLSPEGSGGLAAREVVRRYLAAVEDSAGPGAQGSLAAFRLTRKVAQNLGAFWAQAASQGWPAALQAWGVAELETQPPDILAQGLAGALAGSYGGLETAVARAALATVLWTHLPSPDLPEVKPTPFIRPAATRLAQEFLAAALYMRLVLDLGEPLEAAGRDFRGLKGGLAGLRGWIEAAASVEAAAEPPTPEHWPGLAGWLWVTQFFQALRQNLTGP